jgi:hypothetical protein
MVKFVKKLECAAEPNIGKGTVVQISHKCCLPHDFCYAYGDPGNDIGRKRVDIKIYSDLVTKAGMKKWCAAAFLTAVRTGGTEEFGLSFSWGFAHK